MILQKLTETTSMCTSWGLRIKYTKEQKKLILFIYSRWWKKNQESTHQGVFFFFKLIFGVVSSIFNYFICFLQLVQFRRTKMDFKPLPYFPPALWLPQISLYCVITPTATLKTLHGLGMYCQELSDSLLLWPSFPLLVSKFPVLASSHFFQFCCLDFLRFFLPRNHSHSM